MGDVSVSGAEESVADGIAELVAFGVDGMEVDGNDRSKGIEDRAARDEGYDVGKSSNGGAKRDFLENRITVVSRERREVDSVRSSTSIEGERLGVRLNCSSNDSRRELDHGDERLMRRGAD